MTTGEMERAWGSFSGAVKMIASIVAPFLLIATTTYGVAVAVAGVMSNEIADLMKRMTGQQASEQALSDLTHRVETLTAKLEAVDLPAVAETVVRLDRIATLHHPPQVAEIDTFRSGVYGPGGEDGTCPIEGPCEARYLGRRTEPGIGCEAPTVVSRTVYDQNRFPRIAYAAEGTTGAQAIGHDWSWRSVFFRPLTGQPGPAQFGLVLEYDCGGEVIRQEMPLLPFTLTDGG